jgi:hypothetical protein
MIGCLIAIIIGWAQPTISQFHDIEGGLSPPRSLCPYSFGPFLPACPIRLIEPIAQIPVYAGISPLEGVRDKPMFHRIKVDIIDNEIMSDGIRDTDEIFRLDIEQRLKKLCDNLKLKNIYHIYGNNEERLKKIIEILKL